jgi:nicotinamidase-related amidase
MMFYPTLVVIDMQPSFTSAKDPDVVASVAREIIEAKSNQASIIFLEYVCCFPTLKGLLNLARGYKNKYRLTKEEDDGSLEILKHVKRHRNRINTKEFRVCGVNTDYCVLETVSGMLNKLPDSKIKLVKDACGTDGSNKFNWRKFIKHKNLKLV